MCNRIIDKDIDPTTIWPGEDTLSLHDALPIYKRIILIIEIAMTDYPGQGKADSFLASIYKTSLVVPKEANEFIDSEEKKQESAVESSEGKLKLFLGGLYFQSERISINYI